MFHLLYRHKRDKTWFKFGFTYALSVDCDLKYYRERYRDYRFCLSFEPI